MSKISMYCITLEPEHLGIIKKLNYIPVGLGDKDFIAQWIKDSIGENISSKNRFDGEYTFHHRIWKNGLNNLGNEWIGFCQYRKFWLKENIVNKDFTFESFSKSILSSVPENIDNYDSIHQ